MKKFFQHLPLIGIFVLVAPVIKAQQSPVYSFEKKISLTGNSGYDYLSVDTINHHLFVSHGTSVHVS